MEPFTLFSLFCLVAGAILAWVIRKLIFEKNHVPVQELEAWKQKYQDTNTANAVNESLLAAVKEDLQKATAALDGRGKEVERLIAELADKTTECETLELDKIELKVEINNMKTDLQGKINELQEANATNSGLKEKLLYTEEKLKTQKTEIEKIGESFEATFKALAASILDDKSKKFTEQQEANLKSLLQPLKENITSFKQELENRSRQESNERISLQEQLKLMVQKSDTISQQANNLAEALRGSVKKQGNWGEMILERMLEHSGLQKGVHYELQSKSYNDDGKGIQPDATIKLPGQRCVVVDSKVSLTHYDSCCATKDLEEQERLLQQLVGALRAHIDGLAPKSYHQIQDALDHLIMFVPMEGAYISAMNTDSQLWQYAYSKGILLISPSNFLLALKLVYDMWQKDGMDKNAEAMFNLFRKEHGVFDFIRTLGAKDSDFGRFMKGAVFTIPTPRLLSNVVDMLDGIDMKDRDTKGDLYEYLLSKLSTAGRAGQFRTPRHIIKMMVEMMQPTADDVICDPAAGTCGFLVAASEYFREKHPSLFYDEKFAEHFNKGMFMGMEFDPHMIRVGAMNMILHGIEEPMLKDVDSLSEANTDFTEKASLILANPPFSGSLDYDAVDGSLLKIVRTKTTELLFLALISKGLKKGGRAAVIVPEGVVFGSQKAYVQIRKELVEHNRLEAVISLPSGVFRPYAGVSTAILIFTKTGTGGTDNVWFYGMEKDGFSLDDKRTPLQRTGDGGNMRFPDDYGDIKDILERWKNSVDEASRQRTDKSFMVPVSEIRANDYYLGINKYRELIYEEKVYETPEKIIADIKSLDIERLKALEALEELLR